MCALWVEGLLTTKVSGCLLERKARLLQAEEVSVCVCECWGGGLAATSGRDITEGNDDIGPTMATAACSHFFSFGGYLLCQCSVSGVITVESRGHYSGSHVRRLLTTVSSDEAAL